MKKGLNNKDGGGYITACVITLVIAMILSIVLFYANCMTIIQTTRSNTERVLDSFIMKNSIDIYQSIKQGHNFTEDFDEDYYISETSDELSLDYTTDTLYNYDDGGNLVYSISNFNVSYKVDKTLNIIVGYDLHLPVVFAGKEMFDLIVPATVTSNLTLKEY